jgi:membrane protease YdiL (CAAX protease family)
MQQVPANKSWRDSKLLALAELALAVFFLLGANIFDFIPLSETPFIFILGWISLKLRGLGWSSVGLSRPANWKRTIVVALVAAIGLQMLSTFVTEPLIKLITHRPTDLSQFKPLVGNVPLFLIYMVLIWTLAAFGEELVYRGYMMNRMADLGDRTRGAWVISLLVVSALFGVGHFYQGPTGIADTAITSLVFGALYFYSGRNLWLPILTHGLSDTLGLLLIFFGLVPGL